MAGKKKLIIIVGAVLLLGGGAGGAYMAGLFGGGDDPAMHGEEAAGHGEEAADPHAAAEASSGHVFYELPNIVVNLNSQGQRKGSFLKIKINLELEDKAQVEIVEKMMPRIIDNLQVYLRELRIEDIQGSEGLYRLQEELLHRVNVSAQPAKVNDVLFAELLMQ